MAAEVVQYDDVVWPQGWDQNLFDTGLENLAVDWPVDHPRGDDTVVAKGGDEGHRVPVSEGSLADQALTPCRPTPQRGHVGFGPGFINEDKPLDVNLALMRLPALALALAGDVGPVLLTGQSGFFWLSPSACTKFHIVW